ncbi:glycoside hydrolase family protein [Marinoscillum furvescens]|uniref:Glycosyl hydrolase family 43 n=1 Tax=Marinoscillum furvescens DSM 4134 TaxID=1122208 RepID=A0A3D9L9V7_MARFU|nr:glycoside hydrolase family protein [Marinoscillum furvescens]REE02237.1 hypothetical protein C7460_102262 [Marinoscillum furvescens DSM 4134]
MKKLVPICLLLVVFIIQPSAAQFSDARSGGESLQIIPQPLDPDVKMAFLERRRRANVLVDENYRIWDRSVIQWEDGLYHAYYSRWLGNHKRWLTNSESVHAVSENPEGPFEDVSVVLSNRNEQGWDIVDVHSQFAVMAEGKLLLYYQSCDLRGKFPEYPGSPYPSQSWLDNRDNWDLIRNTQRLGLAIAEHPNGPFVRVASPVAVPEDCERCSNITDNPTVVYQDGQYLMIMKSDDARKGKYHQIQFVGRAKRPDGPFQFNNQPVYAEKRTEDASMWYDQRAKCYYMVCHVLGQRALAMFTSVDGMDWQRASQPVLMKKEFTLTNGEIWKPERLEQPRVLTDRSGRPVMLYVAVADKGVNGNIAVPLITTDAKQ